MIKKAKFFTLLASCLAFLSGCMARVPFQAYPGPQLPHAQHAIIRGHLDQTHTIAKGANKNTFISCINGKNTKRFVAINENGDAAEVYVLPGRNYILATFEIGQIGASIPLWLDAEAGHTYSVKTKGRGAYGHSITMYIVDDKTGKPTGGIKNTGAPKEKSCDR